jgi:hypothetical protein
LGTFTIEDQQVSGPEFFRRAGIAFAVLGLCQAAIAVGLWRDRPWVRPLIMSYWLVSAVLLIAMSWGQPDMGTQALVAFGMSALPALLAWWYLYRKDNVVAYFRARENSSRITSPAA